MLSIGVLISGSGSNLQSIIDYSKNGEYRIDIVISDRECSGIERARAHGIKAICLDRKVYKKDLSKKIDEILSNKVDLIVLAGFLSILDEKITTSWRDRIINIHPSLLPKYGGMYGMNIHRAVIEANDKYSGCTVHYVDAGIDTGKIILQEKVRVEIDDDASDLQKKVLSIEHQLLPKAILDIARNY